jgi:TrmH family RNA methyltransferase
LLRTAEAAGASGVIFTEGCCDPFNPKAVRAAMGSLFRIPFQSDVAWKDALKWLGEKQVRSFALMPRAEQSLDQVGESPAAFWVGAEGEGLPSDLSLSCDARIRIPMKGPVESLNVGTAAALALFYKSFQTP